MQSFEEDLSQRTFPEPVTLENIDTIPPVELEITEISNVGLVTVKFNQGLIRPPFSDYEEQPEVDRTTTVTNTFYEIGPEVEDVKEWAVENYGFMGNAGGGGNRRRRQLLSLNELNVTRDVLQFKYRLRSDVDEKRIKFDLVIKNWTTDGMVLWLNFTEPEAVSNGNVFDQAYVKVLNEKLFVSEQTGL